MVGGVLHAHDTKMIYLASKEISGDSVNIENIHLLLFFVETRFIEWMAPFCIALEAETQYLGSYVNGLTLRLFSMVSLNGTLDSEVSWTEEGLDQGFVTLLLFLHMWHLGSQMD